MVRAFASNQCVPGLILGPGVMWVEFVVGSRPSSEGFSPGSPVFLPPQKSTFLNSNLIRNSRATGLLVEDCYVLPSLNKVNLSIYLFIYLFIYLIIIHSFVGIPCAFYWWMCSGDLCLRWRVENLGGLGGIFPKIMVNKRTSGDNN